MHATPDSLIYYPDNQPGIRRKRQGRGFSYIAPDGTRIDNARERRRIEALAVPPAYDSVWICPRPNGHLQATGRDDRKRKQYRYHPAWSAFRATQKFDQLGAFADALGTIRRRVNRDLGRDAGDHAFALAAVVALIDRAAIRIGNPEYAAENGTYGATTLRTRHMSLDEDGLRLSYIAKGRTPVTRHIRSQKLQKTLQAMDDLPGGDLISWIDDTGAPRRVSSDEVNAYLADVTGDATLTAKTFRTWSGSVAAIEAITPGETPTIKSMAEAAADRLANTPTIARKSYIHPKVIALAEDVSALPQDPRAADGLRVAERQLKDLLAT